jgi:hypothetical protein
MLLSLSNFVAHLSEGKKEGKGASIHLSTYKIMIFCWTFYAHIYD